MSREIHRRRPRPAAAHLTVRDAIDAWLADRAAEGQDTTRAAQQLAAHVLPQFGTRRVAELTAPALRAWRDALAAAPPRRRAPRAARAPRHAAVDLDDSETRRRRRSTVNRIATSFKAALNHAARMHPDQCPNPNAWREGLKAFRRVDIPRERWLEPAQTARLVDACAPDFRDLVKAALYTGCRYGELGRARVGDFDAANRALRIPVSKSGRWRHVIVHDEAVEFFASLTSRRAATALLLTHSDGRPWGRGHQVRPMARACRRARIEPAISFHGLRHTYASLAVQSGMALIALARNLGHADTRMVEKHYGHLSNRYMHEQVGRFAPVLGSGRQR